MPERTVIQWDKDDLDELRLLKVDVLGLGMLTAIRRALAFVSARRGSRVRLADIPAEDPAGLRDDLPRGHGRRVPDRVARADGDAAAARARAAITTSSSRSRSSGPGRSRARWCIRTCAGAAGQEAVDLSEPEVERRARAHARRADLPGAGDAARDRRGGLHAGRGRPAAARDGRVEAQGNGSARSKQRLVEGMRARGYEEELRPAGVPADPRLRRVRFSGVARRELRAARLRLGLAQAARARRVLLRRS